MRINFGNLTVRNLIVSYILLYSIMPIVQRLTSRYLTTYFYMAIVMLLVLLILVLDRPENLNLYGSFLFPFILYEFLTYFTAKHEIFLWGYQTLLFLLPVILGYYFTQDDSRVLSSYSRIILFALIVTMITTIIGCINNPYAARLLATTSDSQDATVSSFDLQNIGGYSFVYDMVLLYPVLILAYKTKKIKLFPTIIIAVVVLSTIVYSEYTIALLLFILSSTLFFTKRNLSARGIVLISIFAVLFLLLFSNVVVDFLTWLSGIVNSEVVSDKIQALAGGTTGLEQAEDNRFALYQTSLNVFYSHPIFGTLIEQTRIDGGHSFLLDNLAQFGFLGGVLMFFMYKNIFKRFFLPFKDKPGFGYVIWVFVQTLILSLVNTGMWLDVLCLFAPIMFYWIYGTESKTEDEKNENTVDSKLTSGSVG